MPRRKKAKTIQQQLGTAVPANFAGNVPNFPTSGNIAGMPSGAAVARDSGVRRQRSRTIAGGGSGDPGVAFYQHLRQNRNLSELQAAGVMSDIGLWGGTKSYTK